MGDHCDFAKMKGAKNPYLKQLRQPITIRLDKAEITDWERFKILLGMISGERLTYAKLITEDPAL